MSGRYVEVCAGAGGLGLGLHRAGWTGAGLELDADACATHRANVGPCLQTDVTLAHAPQDADLVAGGVPCQSFSTAGDQQSELARVLTIAEQRVIAGFPSDYPLPRVRRAAVKALGASVIPACSEWLFNKVMEVIQ